MSQRFAMLIGNSDYGDGVLASLTTPDADVGALADVLQDPKIGGFDEVKPLINETSAVIRREIVSFYSGKQRDDFLLLYFSGHGITDDRGRLYLGVKDTEHALLRGTSISAALITDEMDNSRSRTHALILDCCHSGAFARGAKGAPGASVGTAAAFEGTGVGRVVMTATDSTQYAWEDDDVTGESENSVFTRHLIHGLKSGEADINGTGIITMDDLYDYVFEKVVNETPKQTPGKWAYKQQGEIEVARNLRSVVKPKPLPEEINVAVTSRLSFVREGAIRELAVVLNGPDKGLAASALTVLERMTEDDSRRVSGAAAKIIASYTGATDKVEPQELPPGITERPIPPRPAETPRVVDKPKPASVKKPVVEKPKPAPEKKPVVEKPAPEKPLNEAPSVHILQPALIMFIGWLAHMLLFGVYYSW